MSILKIHILFVSMMLLNATQVCFGADTSFVPATYRQKLLTIHEGLTNNRVTCAIQDSRGYLWIGTEDGLNRYDGYGFEVYRHAVGDKLSISDNYIQSVYEAKNGDVFIGTRFGGLNKWSRATNSFEQLQKQSETEKSLPENEICGILETDSGSLWVKTRNYLASVDFSNKQATAYGHFSNMFKAEEYCNYPLLKTKNGTILVGTKDGLSLFDPAKKTFVRIRLADTSTDYFQGTVFDLLEVGNLLLVSTNDGVFLFDDKNLVLRSFGLPFEMKKGTQIRLCASGNSMVWISTDNGIYRLILSSNRFDRHIELDALVGDMNDVVTSLVEDRSGILWVGTLHNGLVKVDFKPARFRTINNQSIGNASITALAFGEPSSLWIGTIGRGLWKYSKNDASIHELNLNDATFRDLDIKSLFYSSNGKLWIGTNKGLFVHSPTQNKTEEFDYCSNEEFETLLKNNEIRSIAEDLSGNIWLATKFGLYRYSNNMLESFFSDAGNSKSLSHDEVNCLLVDSDNALWIGSRKGINLYRPSTNNFERLTLTDEKANALCNDFVLSIAEDESGNIWVGTRIGLVRYNKASKASRIYTKTDGLANDVISGIVCDKQNRIWVSTNMGISCIVNNLVLNFTANDGLAGYVFNPNAVCKRSNGELYFGGAGGVSFLTPGVIDVNKNLPNVVVNGAKLYQKGDLIMQQSGEFAALEFKFSQNSTLQIDFAALEYTQPHQNRYKVFLEGYDHKWSPPSAENHVVYSNLPPGNYTLKILGSNNDLMWTENPTVLSIVVRPPLYRSVYAIIFYLLAAFLLVQAVVNYRVRKYRKAYINMRDRVEGARKHEVEKETLSKINKSLTDSINYAKRIQEAMLFSEEAVKRLVPDSFIYFRPKDIVSGDFYYFHVRESKLIVAAVDCTGHGVPGAFMSIIGYDLLRNIVEIQGVDCPATILDMLNEQLTNTFNKENTSSQNRNAEVNDGMDLSLCVIDYQKRIVEYAGANNSLYLVRDNELETFDGNRMAIGFREPSGKFTKQQISLYDNDILYLFSDGYTDQFGGADGKKFKYRRFRHLLLNIHKMPMEDQKAILHQKMEEWMGDSYDQIDDMLLIGIKPIQNTLA